MIVGYDLSSNDEIPEAKYKIQIIIIENVQVTPTEVENFVSPKI